MAYVEGFRDLEVYILSRKIFAVTKTFPKDEADVLVDQIRRSSRSVEAQNCGTLGKRRYE